jgi:alkaline phosphatase D
MAWTRGVTIGYIVAGWLMIAVPAYPLGEDPVPAVKLTSGVAASEVDPHGAQLWARCSEAGTLQVAVRAGDGTVVREETAAADATHDYTATVPVTGLRAASEYEYRASCGGPDGNAGPPAQGRFRTAPEPGAAVAATFAWGGDVGGQNACRDAAAGYPVFRAIASRRPDFFVALGDMIYADTPCTEFGRYGNAQVPGPTAPATDLPGFWAPWQYNRADPSLQALLAATPYYAVWDDHEVVDDSGPHSDVLASAPDRHLLPIGRQAFLDYNPLRVATNSPPRLYRTVRWGKHLELMLLDTRSYRDANTAADTAAEPKTMLGREQLTWLKDTLAESDATWKVVVSSVPMAIPTGAGPQARDGWANFDGDTGFERELLDILRAARERDVKNMIWISTDVHFAAVFRHRPFADDPSFVVYEVETGPLTAGVFPKREFDGTLHSERLFLYPELEEPRGTFAQANSWFNFGLVSVDAAGKLRLQVVDGTGKTLYEMPLAPSESVRSAKKAGEGVNTEGARTGRNAHPK